MSPGPSNANRRRNSENVDGPFRQNRRSQETRRDRPRNPNPSQETRIVAASSPPVPIGVRQAQDNATPISGKILKYYIPTDPFTILVSKYIKFARLNCEKVGRDALNKIYNFQYFRVAMYNPCRDALNKIYKFQYFRVAMYNPCVFFSIFFRWRTWRGGRRSRLGLRTPCKSSKSRLSGAEITRGRRSPHLTYRLSQRQIAKTMYLAFTQTKLFSAF